MNDDGRPFSVAELQQERDNKRPLTREQLCERYAKLVYKISQGIHRHLLSNVLLEDIIAYGQTGLLEAYERFDGDYNVSFPTFAYYRIRGEILDSCRRAGWGLKNKKNQNFLDLDEQVIINDFLESEYLDSQDGSDQFAPQLLSPEEQDKNHDCIAYLSNVVSDIAIIVLLRRTSHDFANKDPLPDRRIEKKQRNKVLYQHIKLLDKPSQEVLYLYYYQELSMQEIADHMEISKSWVCRLHSRALKTLSKSLSKVIETI